MNDEKSRVLFGVTCTGGAQSRVDRWHVGGVHSRVDWCHEDGVQSRADVWHVNDGDPFPQSCCPLVHTF